MATNVLDKLGSVGAILAASAAPCCFPFLGIVGSVLGLSFLARYETYVIYAIQIMVLVALAGAFIAYRGHRKVLPLALAIASTAFVIYTLNLDMNDTNLYFGLAGLVVVAIWNTIETRRCAAACMIK